MLSLLRNKQLHVLGLFCLFFVLKMFYASYFLFLLLYILYQYFVISSRHLKQEAHGPHRSPDKTVQIIKQL